MNSKLKSIIGAVELKDLHLVETRASLHLENIEPESTFRWTLNTDKIQHCGKFISESRLLVCGVRFFLGAAVGKGSEPVVEVFCEYSLTYALPDEIPCSDDDAAEFCALNGVYNAWPFFREHVQSLTSKMNVPPIILPLRRFCASEVKTDK